MGEGTNEGLVPPTELLFNITFCHRPDDDVSVLFHAMKLNFSQRLVPVCSGSYSANTAETKAQQLHNSNSLTVAGSASFDDRGVTAVAVQASVAQYKSADDSFKSNITFAQTNLS